MAENVSCEQASITSDEARKLAQLSCLLFDDSDLSRFTEKINAILGYVSSLNAISTSPSTTDQSHAGTLQPHLNVMREDIVIASLTTEEALEGAPESLGGYFKVPLVIDEA
jgi:aspartyl-tRNA(Asn)/glutamyl-tRNA(Gln) amidotransferase subunit C